MGSNIRILVKNDVFSLENAISRGVIPGIYLMCMFFYDVALIELRKF